MGISKNKALIFSLLILQVGIVSSAFSTESLFRLDSFSVDLPTSSLWQKNTDTNQISMGRLLDRNPLHTFSLSAVEYPVAPEPITSISSLLLHISNAYKKEALNEGRYKLTDHSEESTSRLGIECVEYKKKYIDKGSEITQNKILIMIAHGLICVHPNATDHLVEISYSTRNTSGIITEESLNEGNMFLNSLKALPIKSNKSLKQTGANNAPPG